MFGHLKAEDFTNLLDGIAIPARRRLHLEKCGPCAKQWKAVEAIHLSIAVREDDIIEPDWSEFRASVRNEMLSRAARRSAETRRWTAWKLAPAGVSLAAALGVGLALSRFLAPAEVPHGEHDTAAYLVEENILADVADGIETATAVWVSASAWDEVISLGPEESERFRELLEIETRRLTRDYGPAELTQ